MKFNTAKMKYIAKDICSLNLNMPGKTNCKGWGNKFTLSIKAFD